MYNFNDMLVYFKYCTIQYTAAAEEACPHGRTNKLIWIMLNSPQNSDICQHQFDANGGRYME